MTMDAAFLLLALAAATTCLALCIAGYVNVVKTDKRNKRLMNEARANAGLEPLP